MTEAKQQQVKKKAVILWKIFRWFGLAILGLLLITLIIFHAPWKIITLLAVVLAACTFLPEPHRKWFWLFAAVTLIAVTVWIFLPEDNEEWSTFTFDDEIAGYEAKYAIPDEENAAVIYNELLRDYDSQQMDLKFLPPGVRKVVLSKPWIGLDYPELIQWMRGHENTIAILQQAGRMETCRFPGNFNLEITDKLLIDRYTALKSWTVLLLLSANNDIAEGRLEQGLSKYVCALRIADHLYQQKRIVDFLISFGIEGLALPPINRLVIEDKLSDKQLKIISDCLTNLENNWRVDFLQCLEYDKFFVKNTFCSLVFEKDSNSRVRYSRNPAAAIWQRFRHGNFEQTYRQKKSMKAYAILAWFALPSNPQKAAEIIEEIYEECHAMAEPGYTWDNEQIGPPALELNCHFLIWLLTNKTSRLYGGFHDIYLTRLAQRRGLKLLIAIKQYNNEHGSWPESLDKIKTLVPPEALLDPICDVKFVYSLDGDTFRLYSKGPNHIDEAGQRDYFRASDTYQDDIAIWPLTNQQIGIPDND